MVPRGSKPSSSASIANDETLLPSNISLDLVMNWVEALATIVCLMLDVSKSAQDTAKEENWDKSIRIEMEVPKELE